MQLKRCFSSSMRISQTCERLPTWIGRAVPVTRPLRTARRWFALISWPTQKKRLPSTQQFAATLPSVSASVTEAPPCSKPNGCQVRASTASSRGCNRARFP